MTKKKTKKKKSIKNHKPAKPIRVHFHTNRKPEFEKALDEVVPNDQLRNVPEGPGTARRGGTRPGPDGQDPGAPDNLARLDRELSKAPQALAPVLKIPFSIWASVSQIPEMKLTDPEAEEWAEPMVALLEYYFPGKIPEIIWIWLLFLTATEKVIDSRVKIRYEKLQERSHSASSAPSGPAAAHTTRQPAPAPAHNGAEPALSYPQE